ncbi:hypothetical protein C1645_747413, partial [Glomus cerebriforme]
MYKLNIILILCLCAAIFTFAVPLDMTSHSSSSLTSRSAMPLNLTPNASAIRQSKKRRGLIIPTLDLTESEAENPSTIKNRMIKRDPIDYTVDPTSKDSIVHTKRAQKKARRSFVWKIDDNIKRN